LPQVAGMVGNVLEWYDFAPGFFAAALVNLARERESHSMRSITTSHEHLLKSG
jgi:hypothetical protein